MGVAGADPGDRQGVGQGLGGGIASGVEQPRVEGLYSHQNPGQVGVGQRAANGLGGQAVHPPRGGMRGDRASPQVGDSPERLFQRQPFRNGVLDKQGQQVPLSGGDFASGNDLHPVDRGQILGFQPAPNLVVIGDRDHIQSQFCGPLQDRLDVASAIPTIDGVNVQICQSHAILLIVFFPL